MEAEPTDVSVEAPQAEELKHYKRRRKEQPLPEENAHAEHQHQQQMEALLPLLAVPEENVSGETPPQVEVSLFDYSVENYFRAIDTVSKLCGEPDIDDSADQAELRWFKSSITFLSEWRYFKYKPRSIRFACENDSGNGKDINREITLPQFSAVTVPKGIKVNEKAKSPKSS